MKRAVVYYRVSTDKQGIRGLGMEAQKDAVDKFCKVREYEIIDSFCEVESRKKNNRPAFEKARALARATKSVLIVSKLDRLSGDVDLIRAIKNSSEDVVFVDFPDIPEGPLGKLMITMMAAFAEFEVGQVSIRTKAALAAAKKRGVKLGNPNIAEYNKTRTDMSGIKAGHETQSQIARQKVSDVSPTIRELQSMGVTTLGGLAAALNAKGIEAPKGGKWYKMTVSRTLNALQ